MDATNNFASHLGVLHLPVISDHVLSMWLPSASVQDLKNIRLVSKSWNRASLHWWRKQAVLCIHWPHNNIQHWTYNQPTKTLTSGIFPGALLEMITQSDRMPNECGNSLSFLPFEKYAFYNFFITPPHLMPNSSAWREDKYAEIEFWLTVGYHIKHLRLQNVRFSSANGHDIPVQDSDLIRFFHEYLSNLSHLTLDSVSNGGFIGRNALFRPTAQIGHQRMALPNIRSLKIIDTFGVPLFYFPNLEQLKFAGESHLVKLLRSFYYCNNLTTIPSVKSLDMMESKNFERKADEPVSSFPKILFSSLTHLSVNVDPVLDNKNFGKPYIPGFLFHFLQRHAITLESLHIFHSVGRLPSGPILPDRNYPNLKELRLWGFVVEDLTFLNYMPNLKLLHMDTSAIEKEEEGRQSVLVESPLEKLDDIVKATLEIRTIPRSPVYYLTYFHIDQQLSSGSIHQLGQWMPFLKTFKSILDFETFSLVCTQWGHLEYLHCLFSSSLEDNDIYPIQINGTKGLYDLKDLTSFRYDAYCGASKLTDRCFGAAFFKKLPKMTDLRICVSEQFSEAAELFLRQHIRHVRIYRNYPSNPLHKDWKCCRVHKYKFYIYSCYHYAANKLVTVMETDFNRLCCKVCVLYVIICGGALVVLVLSLMNL